MNRLLLACAFLFASFLPAADPIEKQMAKIGAPIATTAVADGVLTLHERGMVLRYLDGSRLVTSLIGAPPVLTASWQHDTGAGVITVTATYEFPVPNPTEAQRRLYAERFREIVKDTLSIFPANVT